MLDKFMKGLVDFIYRTGRARKKFERDNPNEIVLAADASKGVITKKDQDIQHGANWVTSQRAIILLTDKKIVCGKWVISLDEVSAVQLIKYGSGQVLKIQTNNGIHYQFGMHPNPKWTNQQILPLTLEKGQVKYSFFSIIVRLILIGYIIYFIYSRFISR
jgi:hypothetical protein